MSHIMTLFVPEPLAPRHTIGVPLDFKRLDYGKASILELLQNESSLKILGAPSLKNSCINWVAVKELNLSYYIGETLLFTIYAQYSNLI